MIFNIKVSNGKADLTKLEEYLSNLEGSIEVQIHIDRTKNQNDLMWALLRRISNYTGDSPEYFHEKFKTLFLQGGSTTELSKKDFVDYIDKINLWCYEYFGFYVIDDDFLNYNI